MTTSRRACSHRARQRLEARDRDQRGITGGGDGGHREHLSGDGLGGRDSDFRAGLGQQGQVADLRQRAARLIGDADDHGTGPAHAGGRLDDLGCRPGLAERDREVPAVIDVGLVPGVDAGRGQSGGAPCGQLDQVAAVDGDVVRRPASQQDSAGQRARTRAARQRGRYLVTVGHVPADEAVQDLGLLGELGCHHGSGGHWRSSCSGAIVGDRKHQYGITMLGAAVRGVWGWAGRGVRQATRRRPWRGGMPGEQALRGLAGPYR